MSAVRWSREAQADIAQIDDHYHMLNPGYAARVAAKAAAAAKFLQENMEAGQLVGRRVRKWRVQGTPYILFYRHDGRFLRIVRVVHSARDWKRFVE